MNMEIETSIVPQEQWSRFADAYENLFGTAINVAIQSLREIFKPKDIEFTDLMLNRKLYSDVPSFNHLSFRYQNKVFAIIFSIYGIEGVDAAIMPEHEFDALVAECQKNNLTPCVFPVDAVNERPIADGCHLLDALTKQPINIDEVVDEQGKEVWSEWEYNIFGILEVVKCLQQYGINIPAVKWVDLLEYQPQLYFWTDDGATPNYVIIRTVPAGLADKEFFINKSIFDNLPDWNGYLADIRVCSQWNTLDFNDTEILRIAPVYRPGFALEPIEEAIKNHEYIKLVEG